MHTTVEFGSPQTAWMKKLLFRLLTNIAASLLSPFKQIR